MADTQEQSLGTITPVDGDYFRAVDDPGGTPISSNVTGTALKAYLKAYFDTLYFDIATPPKCSVYVTTDFNTTTSLESVTFEDQFYDTDSMWISGAATRITINTAGTYLITANIAWSSGTAGTYRHAGIYVNNNTSNIVAHMTVPAASSGITTMTISGQYNLAANDYVQLKVQAGETEATLYAYMAALRLA